MTDSSIARSEAAEMLSLLSLQVTANCGLLGWPIKISSALASITESKDGNTRNHQSTLSLIQFVLHQLWDVILSFGTHLTRKLFPVKAESYKFSLFQQQAGRHTCYQEKFTRKLLSLSRIILNCSKIFQPEPNVPTKMN